ncbi:MAG TPA: FxLYD domain-containing protein [Candidatus Acidoferrales bacterium]|jgi:hypothetical protein|nr:FxLYD domain-containing protein [Candidatus Acidoferrales bacterium]
MTESDFLKIECRHCAGHIEYPAGAGGQSIACPHCGQPVALPPALVATVKKSRRPLVGGMVVVLWAAIIAATMALILLKRHVSVPVAEKALKKSVVAVPPAAVKSGDETTTNGFAVSVPKLEKTPGSALVYVAGTVRNLTDKQRFGVKAEFGLIDSNGVSAGAASDYTATLEPNGTWKFKALVMGSKAAQARLNSIRDDQ